MTTTSSQPIRCKCRRRALTGLRCSRCDVAICPDCSVVAPVGMLCRECARAGRSPLYQVGAGRLTLAFLVCLGVATAGGWLVTSLGFFGFFGLWFAFLYGLAVAEVALRATGRKRGIQMEILAGVCSALGLIAGLFLNALGPTGPRTPVPLLFHLLRSPWPFAMLVVAVFAAVSRIRNI